METPAIHPSGNQNTIFEKIQNSQTGKSQCYAQIQTEMDDDSPTKETQGV